jgi:hypothetical protein
LLPFFGADVAGTVGKFVAISITPAVLVANFASSVIYTGGKFAINVINAGGAP